jgi:hypothetical protein
MMSRSGRSGTVRLFTKEGPFPSVSLLKNIGDPHAALVRASIASPAPARGLEPLGHADPPGKLGVLEQASTRSSGNAHWCAYASSASFW